MLAAVGDTPYNIVRLIHLVAVILGVGLAFAGPILAVRSRRSGGQAVQRQVDAAVAQLMFPSLLVAGIAGGALVGLSDDFWDFGQAWLSIAGALWIVILVLVLAVYPPDYLRFFDLAEDRKKALGGVLHLALAVMLVLMVWKFGAPDGAY